MNTRLAYSVLTAVAIFTLCACKDMPSKNHGPIILGDSSTIVTEKDPEKLQDMVTDLHPDIPSSTIKDTEVTTKDTIAQVHTDTVKKAATPIGAQQAETPTNGIKADFGETSVLVGNVNAKLAGKPDLKHATGAVYTLVNGNINGNILKVTGNVTKVSQRYQSIIILKDGPVTLPIDALSNTTDWQPLKGGNNMYRITGLEPSALEYSDAGPAEIRNAVTRAGQRRRMGRKKIQELVNSLHNARKANQKPLYVVLRSVMWKIDGKDDKGKPFSRQVRVDVPM